MPASRSIGTAAGEAQNPRAVLPRAINNVIWRICAVLCRLGDAAGAAAALDRLSRPALSPFVTFFGSLGVPGIGTVMNMVVLTAALSSLNSGLYSTGRVLRSPGDGRIGAQLRVPQMNAAAACPMAASW